MSTNLDDNLRSVFAGIADILIPAAEGMPAATEVGVHETLVDRILGLRPDLREAFMRGLKASEGKDPKSAAEHLNSSDAAALGAIGLVASAGYYMTPRVRELIGYTGQESRAEADPDATPEYVANGMLQQVIDRGAMFKPTPR
ncbi:MAG: hypothetical protein P8Q36_00600 [Alphaproteobacteria bacterium]|jgi:hypothetical protein|nr:hypothetical protein [Alphaproteobacteria bacterium]